MNLCSLHILPLSLLGSGGFLCSVVTRKRKMNKMLLTAQIMQVLQNQYQTLQTVADLEHQVHKTLLATLQEIASSKLKTPLSNGVLFMYYI